MVSQTGRSWVGPERTRWLSWLKVLRSIAQSGLTYAEDPFDLERYSSILEVAAEIAASYSGAEFEVIERLFADAQGYETPKVDVRGVVFREDRILLVRELQDNGRWTLPGGWADVNDLPHEAVEREVWEESGYRVRAAKLLAVWDRRLHGHAPPMPYGIYKLFFLCDLLSDDLAEAPGASCTIKASIETSSPTFFSEHDIPELSLGRTTPWELARLFEHRRHPDWPADFD
jgi:ADP-ribose pyrophosphatase YjhB (NUDIX family)